MNLPECHFLPQVTEQPSQDERMREAMSVIAEVRDSERLRQFLKTGVDRAYYQRSINNV